MLSGLRRILPLLPPPLRWYWLSVVPLVVLTAAGEAVGAAAVFVLVRIVTDPTQLSVNPFIAAYLPHGDQRTMIVSFTMAVALFYVLKNGLAILTEYVRSRCVNGAAAALSTALLRGYLAAPYTFHLQRNSADLIDNVNRGAQHTFAVVASATLSVVTETLVVLGILSVLLWTAPVVTLIAGAVLLALSAGFLRLSRRTARHLGVQMQALSTRGLRHLQQALGAIKEVKVLGREPFFGDAFAETGRSLARVGYRYATMQALPRILVETAFVCGALFVIVLVTLGGGTGPYTASLLGLYGYAGFRIIPSANRILWLLNEVRYGGATMRRVFDDLDALSVHTARLADSAPAVVPPFADRVDLEQVSYAYDGSGTLVLHDVTVTIHRGESIGIVGPTGAGKSTLVDIVLGLLRPSSGNVIVDGVDVFAHPGSWQRRIGYVPQAVYLTDDTLRRNIAFGLTDAGIDEERVHAALRMAQLDDVVAALPDGLDTIVGERGVRLSGGQRQRVAIARALYHQPEVLVLDEATAALDYQTEHALQRAMDALHGRKTMVIIAHRLSTVRHCDRLLFLRDGRVNGVGSFDELMAGNTEFRKMATALGHHPESD